MTFGQFIEALITRKINSVWSYKSEPTVHWPYWLYNQVVNFVNHTSRRGTNADYVHLNVLPIYGLYSTTCTWWDVSQFPLRPFPMRLRYWFIWFQRRPDRRPPVASVYLIDRWRNVHQTGENGTGLSRRITHDFIYFAAQIVKSKEISTFTTLCARWFQ